MTFTYAPFYDVDRSVGDTSPNQEADVMLVQYFLFSIMIDSTWPLPFGPFVPTDAGPDVIFPVDGVPKPGLSSWIWGLQKTANENLPGVSLTLDGIVSHGGAAWGRTKPRAANFWTIHAMNDMLFHSDKIRFCALATDPSVPAALQSALQFTVAIDPVPFP